MIIGIDEVGRGPLAGPVVACACHVPLSLSQTPQYAMIKDSKRLSASQRNALAPWLRAHTLFALGQASVAEIDRVNILQATFLAMERAYAALAQVHDMPNAQILIDGNRTPPSLPLATTVIGGDAIVKDIAAASIIAKVHRDQIMSELALSFSDYGWEKNAGYGTAAHRAAIVEHGPSSHHRMSFLGKIITKKV